MNPKQTTKFRRKAIGSLLLLAGALGLSQVAQAQPFLTGVGGIAGNDPNNGGAVYFISVRFSDPAPGPGSMDISGGANGMANVNNYLVDGSPNIFSAQVEPDGFSVLLEVPAATVTGPPSFNVTVSGVQDGNGSVIVTTNLSGTLNTAFTALDIGFPNVPGNTFVIGNTFTVTGGGNALNSKNNDQYQFVYETVTGNFDRKVQITGITNNNPGVVDAFVRGGLICRGSVDTGAQLVDIFADWPGGDNAVRMYCRYASLYWETNAPEFVDGQNTHFGPGLGGVAAALPNLWLRLKRVGDDFITYVGTNGVNWTKAGEKYFPSTPDSPGMPHTMLVGMFAAAAVQGAQSIASFQNYGDGTPSDATKPVLLSAGTIDKVNVGLKFSKYLDDVTVAQIGNYTLSQGTVTAATIGFSGKSVFLTVSGLTDNSFTVTASGVKDTSGNTMASTTVNASLASGWQAQDTGQFGTTNTDACWSPSVNYLGGIPGIANRPQITDDPWQIGKTVAVSSGATIDVETFGGGCNLWNNADNGQFVYRTLTGDFDVQVSVDRLDRSIGTQGYGFGALSAKASLYRVGTTNACGDDTFAYTAAGSKVMDVQNATYEIDTQGRTAISLYRVVDNSGYGNGNIVGSGTQIPGINAYGTNNGINGVFGKQGLVAINASGTVSVNSSPTETRWLRMARGTNKFYFYYSYDGKTWRQYDTYTATFANTLLVGWQMAADTTGTLYPGGGYATNMPSSFVTALLGSFGDYHPTLAASTDASGNRLISWGPSILGTLQSASVITGPWTDVLDGSGNLVTGAYNGGGNNAGPNIYTNSSPSGTAFYRLRY